MTADVATVGSKIGRGAKRGLIEPDQHYLHLYDTDEELIEALAVYFAIGLARDEAALCIAEPHHASMLIDYLTKMGVDPSGAKKRGMLVLIDATEALEAVITRNEVLGQALPKRGIFESFIDESLRLAGGSERRLVRAFDGLPALLFKEGNPAAAICLEQLWDEAIANQRVRLYCGYPKTLTGEGSTVEHRHICRSHGYVLDREEGLLTEGQAERAGLTIDLAEGGSDVPRT